MTYPAWWASCDVFINTASKKIESPSPLNIAVAGTGYVGLSIATLLAQHNHVTAVDVIPEKVEMLNNRKSPIQDLSLIHI